MLKMIKIFQNEKILIVQIDEIEEGSLWVFSQSHLDDIKCHSGFSLEDFSKEDVFDYGLQIY